mmetsp:Transcript_39254/g.62889  ORF Transcript_39254/g.62889 Transcript_39254/m.62889 type:complete len:210 (+) Transcript_39254:373-1002(+)
MFSRIHILALIRRLAIGAGLRVHAGGWKSYREEVPHVLYFIRSRIEMVVASFICSLGEEMRVLQPQIQAVGIRRGNGGVTRKEHRETRQVRAHLVELKPILDFWAVNHDSGLEIRHNVPADLAAFDFKDPPNPDLSSAEPLLVLLVFGLQAFCKPGAHARDEVVLADALFGPHLNDVSLLSITCNEVREKSKFARVVFLHGMAAVLQDL